MNPMRRRARLLFPFAAILAAALQGCATVNYYAQSIAGHLDILARRQPTAALLADPQTDPTLRARLNTINALVDFAHARLSLPDNGSYSSYAALDRTHPVWTVFASPEFSLQALQWCFPVVGCLAYRGYFSNGDAEAFAASLAARGHDVHVAGATAYSTLGWFKDPVVSSMLRWPDTILAKVIFHELAHQRVYVPNDAVFNESFATAVAHAGVMLWLSETAPAQLDAYLASHRHEQALLELIDETRQHLRALYAGAGDATGKRRRKQEIFGLMQEKYRSFKRQQGMDDAFDPWFEGSLNNARLGALSTYHELAPSFERLLKACGDDLRDFYAAVDRIGGLPELQRRAALAPGCATQ